MTHWTEAQLAEHNLKQGKGRKRGEVRLQRKKNPSLAKISPNILSIIFSLKSQGIKFETEYKFLPDRKFRFDIAILEKKVAIEYNGGIYMKRGGHANFQGQTTNSRKLNLAQLAGWKVLQFTNEDFKEGGIKNVMAQIIKAISAK